MEMETDEIIIYHIYKHLALKKINILDERKEKSTYSIN